MPFAVQNVSPEGYSAEPEEISFSIVYGGGLYPATLGLSVIETGHGYRATWTAIAGGVVSPGWDIAVAYSGATPSRIDVVIRGWPLDLASTYRRIEMVVEIDEVPPS